MAKDQQWHIVIHNNPKPEESNRETKRAAERETEKDNEREDRQRQNLKESLPEEGIWKCSTLKRH